MKWMLMLVAMLVYAPVNAQLIIKNTKSETYQVAVAMRQEGKDFKGWLCKGWFKIAPGDSAAVGELSGMEVRYFLHTLDNKMSQGGNKPMLVDKQNAFTIKNADLKGTEKSNPGYIWRDFHSLPIPEEAKKDGRFMIVL